MANEDQTAFEEAFQMALAGLAGAADETSFGLAEKYVPGVKRLHDENPGSFATGQVGSYFIPGTGIIGGAKGLRSLFKAGQLAHDTKPALGLLRKMIEGAVKGGVTGGVEAGGQTVVRKALGTKKEGNALDDAKTGATWGAGLGAISPALGSLARGIYSHPTIANTKVTKSPALMQKLMDEGVWGTEKTFRDRAASGKEQYNKILDPYRKELAGKKIDVNDIFKGGGYADRERDKKLLGLTSAPQFAKTREGTKLRLGDRPPMSEVNELLSTVNKELSTLQPLKRTQVVTGVGGSAADEDQALGALKAAIEEMEKKMIIKKSGQRGADDIARAKESYGTGRELERALDRPESLSQAFKSAIPGNAAIGTVGTIGGLAAGATTLPAILTGAGAIGLTHAAKSLPGRTGMGVLLNKVGKSPTVMSEKAGRLTEYAGRENAPGNVELIDPDKLDSKSGSQVDRQSDDNEFSQFVPAKASVKFNEGIDPEARAASLKHLGINSDVAEMVKDPSNEKALAKAQAILNRRKKKAPIQDDTEDSEETDQKEENPFLEYVPAR